ncbi:hypothetical protein HPB52_015723 [Rhipicephalus sanguineus]|uniref:Peptidase M13 N-terminal domain-containing protein n=1 Tax=Rhipicephalus sanguineus TaxID=34632 RepID=A0A9D4YQ49_RHISA|nr:hypothetical protein HPB52_015723 [Rhipicephalus sanguineus]
MFSRTGDQVELNAAIGDAWASNSSSSSSSSSSSDSDVNAFGGRRRITRPARRPGFQRLELHELHEVRQMQAAARRAADAAARGDNTGNALEPPALPGPAPMNQEHNGGEVVVRRGNWHMNQRFQAVLSATAILCSIALLVYLGATLWIRIKYRDIFRASTRKVYADHADLPLFSGCDEMACQQYMTALRTSINKSQDPCKNFYGFVCDGWKHQHRLLSVVDAAEDSMYKRALNTVKRASHNGRNQARASSSVASVEKKVAALARSCMELSESSLQDLKRFMSEHHLPWPEKSRWDPLAILLDLSGNWNIHLWFQVNVRLSPFRVGSTEPVLKIVPSAAFRSWIATMRLFIGHPTGSARSLRYRRYVRRMLRLFDVPGSRSGEIISTIEAMNKLTLERLAPAMTAPEPRIVRMSIRNLTETGTLRIPTGRLVLLFNEYLMWARRFSPNDVVQVENVGLLRSIIYILGLDVETQEALTLSLGLRVVHELGWMAHREIADVTLEIAGLPPSAHTRRCLVEIENAVGVGWLSLFPIHQESDSFIRDVRDVLIDAVARRNLPPAVNYGGAGRLIADEVLRGLFHELMYNQSHSRRNGSRAGYVRLSNNTEPSDWPPYHVDIKALLAALSAYRLAVVQDMSSAYARLSSLAQDRLFFVASCYALCSSGNYVDPLYGDARHRCNEPLKQLSEFAAAFRCRLPYPQI